MIKNSIIETGFFSGYEDSISPSGGKINDNFENQKIVQWADFDGNITASPSTFKRLESGYYQINYDNSLGIFFKKENPLINKLYKLPNEASNIILSDISKFWNSQDKYDEYKRVFKRNYLLYSAPGTGKTSLINLMCEDLIEKYNGIVLSVPTYDELKLLVDAIKLIRKIEPDRKIIVIIEDIDSFTQNAKINTLLLNILDGNFKFSGVVVIATTNHIEMMEDRYVNRPSRFDRVVEFPLPDEECRRSFLSQSIHEEDLKTIDLDEWVRKTKGYTIDHLNELVLTRFVFGHGDDESFEMIEKMMKNNGFLKNKSSVSKTEIGF